MRKTLALAAALAFAAPGTQAYDGLVEKKVFEMPSYETISGGTIKAVRVGYETIGTLNAAGDNAILIPHFYSGNSHFAGKYKADDRAPGYWDAIVGPGKPLDTDKFFLIGIDSLCNLNAKDGVTVTTGPDSTAGGLDAFPVLQIGDFVRVQKAVLDRLGVKRLHAVMGASMGAMQSWDWAARYPDFVPRIVSVIGTAAMEPYGALKVRTWADAIKVDPKWKGGAYAPDDGPVMGLVNAFKLVNIDARAPAWAEAGFGIKPADPARDPRSSWANDLAIQKWNDDAASPRAKVTDANNFLCLAKANETFVLGSAASLAEGVKAVKAKALLLPAKADLLLFPENSRRVRDLLKAQGNEVEYAEIDGPLGHLDGIANIGKVANEIAAFLAK